MKKLIQILIWLANIPLMLFAFMGAMMSPMLFDAPGSTESIISWIIFSGILTMPLVSIISYIISIILYRKKHLNHALMVSAVPFLYTLLVYGFFYIVD